MLVYNENLFHKLKRPCETFTVYYSISYSVLLTFIFRSYSVDIEIKKKEKMESIHITTISVRCKEK